MEEQIVIEGVVDDIIYQNEENGYTVCTIEYEGEEVSCVGNLLGAHPGEEIRIVGQWATHPVYGKQLKVDTFERSIPKTVQGIERYLASGAIKGIGPKTAKKIVKHFGLDTFRIIESEPTVLAQIQGISDKKAVEIGEVFRAQHELRNAMLVLQEFGITPTYAIKIYKRYKDKTIEVIKTNPYRLAEDIFGIGFKKADEIAAQIGIDKSDPQRIKTGILYLLNNFSMEGHTYMPRDILVEKSLQLLGVPEDFVDHAMSELIIQKAILVKNYNQIACVFLSRLYHCELKIARKLIDLAATYDKEMPFDFDKELKQTQKELSIELVEEQREAVRYVLMHGVTILTGGPGTGKTTTIKAILHMLEKANEEVLLAAPTGRAAKRMSEATEMKAQTIHRLLEIGYLKEDSNRQMFNRNDENPLEADVVIIDEMSMVDVNLMYALLEAVQEGQRLILIGDADQLPSVGAGNVLKDMIKSERLPVVRLTQIFRQARESAIVMNAHRINQGKEPVNNEKGTDFFFMNRSVQQQVQETIVELITTRIPKFQKVDFLKDIQVLAPMRKGLLGVNELNKLLQGALNGPSAAKIEKEYRDTIFRVGDKVMQIKNNYNTPWKVYAPTGYPLDEGIGVFNGDCGMIKDLDLGREILTVLFDDQKTVEYEFNQLDELELAYAVTIHKSQGSEYPVVILPIHSGPPMLLSRNLLYTAVTRAKKMVVIVGVKETVNRMIENNREVERYSSLGIHLQQLI
ncbi:MAG: ATP-dependent RecD-like DNA helicase [Niameybacter sp.]|uniref:SF1B family DNA helicase RecD2 n=1 Tax=Niameybacter sp. TaxID=2033640 RepID=UPI002FC78889